MEDPTQNVFKSKAQSRINEGILAREPDQQSSNEIGLKNLGAEMVGAESMNGMSGVTGEFPVVMADPSHGHAESAIAGSALVW